MGFPRARVVGLLSAILLPVLAAAADVTKLEDLTVMALGALDGRAVVKTPDGKMQVIKVGDTVPGTHAVVAQVLADKIVLEDAGTAADKSAKKQTVWISKAAHAGGKSTVQRFDSEGPPSRIVEGKTMQPAQVQSATPKKGK